MHAGNLFLVRVRPPSYLFEKLKRMQAGLPERPPKVVDAKMARRYAAYGLNQMSGGSDAGGNCSAGGDSDGSAESIGGGGRTIFADGEEESVADCAAAMYLYGVEEGMSEAAGRCSSTSHTRSTPSASAVRRMAT